MARIIWWSLAGILLLSFIVLMIIFTDFPMEFSGIDSLSNFLGLSIMVAAVAFVCVGVSIFSSFIPYKGMEFKDKLVKLLPVISTVLLLFVNVSLGYTLYQKETPDITIGPSKDYNMVNIPDSLSCQDVRNGKFETKNLIITRTGDQQIQENKNSGEIDYYNVTWVADCEYLLRQQDDSAIFLKVKIVSVSASSYECYVATNRTENAGMYELKRID